MFHRRLLATLVASLAVALVAAAALAGTATTAAADGVYFGFGYHDGPRVPPPPPRWGWGPPPGPGWGRPGWGPPRHSWGPPPTCRPRWVNRPIVDPWGRIVRYQRVEIMDCGPRRHRW
ncbi:hypothetical protein [Pleomorphomonas sp. NRK KF1]|uniref:hypothetical protein n=1 Tax=Pleomorphomonas sp. NRK KF1 TaxID=2943000 RepID=UPI0020446973|nr:hypothetical protein [Pleomorphomonas sp. NRK KF1]MCM5554641.1 hypothetical protein [Pleomorphomonas sp. NRK KF1]